MSILFIASDYKPRTGGIAAYIDTLARGLRDLGHDAKVLAVIRPAEVEKLAFIRNYEPWVIPLIMSYDVRPENWVGDKWVSVLEIARCLSTAMRCSLERTRFFRNSCEAVSRLRQILGNDIPQAVVFGHLDEGLYPLALFLQESGIPYAVIAHDYEVSIARYRLNDRVRRGSVLKRATWLVANSRHTSALLREWGIPEENIAVQHPPVCDEVLSQAARHLRAANNESYNLVTICRLVESKGVDIAISAVSELRNAGTPVNYTIAGAGPSETSLRSLVTSLGLDKIVHFAGYVNESQKCALLGAADVFIMPSRVNPRKQHEGFGLAFIEAAAFGVVPVGTKAGGIPEAILDGETGVLVEPDSPEKLSAALRNLYERPDERERLGQAARHRVINESTPTVAGKQFMAEMAKRTNDVDLRTSPMPKTHDLTPSLSGRETAFIQRGYDCQR